MGLAALRAAEARVERAMVLEAGKRKQYNIVKYWRIIQGKFWEVNTLRL